MDVRIIRFFRPPDVPMPLYVHTVGYNRQNPLARPEGFSTHQLLFSRSGRGHVLAPAIEEFEFGPMQYMMVPAGLPHEYYPVLDEPWEVGYVSFSGTQVDSILKHFGIEPFQPRTFTHIEKVWNTLDAMWDLAEVNKDDAVWEGVRLLYGLLLDLNHMQLVDQKAEQLFVSSPMEEADSDVVQKTSLYLNEHYNEIISLSNVATSLGYTHQYLNRLFRKSYGVSMLQYVQKVRLDHAIGFMNSKENTTIKEIASYVGMETNYFIRMFRRATGKTPDQYRKDSL